MTPEESMNCLNESEIIESRKIAQRERELIEYNFSKKKIERNS